MINQKVLFTVVCLLLFAAVCSAQQDKAALTGTATDSSGAVIVGAVVEVTNPTNGSRRQVTTNGAGTYYVPALTVGTVGTYEVLMSKPGFRSIRVAEVQLEVGQTRTL